MRITPTQKPTLTESTAADRNNSTPPIHYGKRLPCRGCRSNCKYYEVCDGRPWRTLSPTPDPVS